ncbi:MAG TPA: T9SS type A sorting domain-containing protein, partial [Chitinophagales bacterium]|nr:T9SS type A sorting domain-containing protein [Chitinophagales bacterium]
SGSTLIVFPDSVPVELDTGTAFETGDTIDINLAGLDTLFILYEDTNSIGGDTVSEVSEFRLVDATKDITITPGFLPKEVEHGLFGYHIEGIFTSERLPQDTANVNFPQSWRWMADLKPQVLRFPGGASSRWMHLLPYQDAEAPFDTLDPIKGYGYDITEIIRYYDGTDGDIDAEDSVYVNSIIYDLADASCDSCDNWMYAFKYADDFEKLYDKWINQENNIPTNQQQRYIDQFIALVDSIQQWESYTVDVIVDLNVISESATDCRHIIDYLRNPAPKAEGGNGVTAVNVVGVEMGNECNLNWGTDIMGWKGFNDYWYLINGKGQADIPDGYFSDDYNTWLDSLSAYVFSPEYYEDHDFISAFKSDPDLEIKVGIPAANLKNNDSTKFAFRMMEDLSTNWNDTLVTHFQDSIVVGDSTRYLFDAVVLHTYYDAQTNWDSLATSNLCDSLYPNSGIAGGCVTEDCDDWTNDQWQFDITDERLSNAYKAVIGLGSNGFGNFKQFIRTRYAESYDQQRLDLMFYGNEAWKKDLWTTEWNLKDKNTDYSANDPEQYILSSFCNSFEHGWLIQEWFLKDIKQNYAKNYRKGFHTYSTFHAFGGGSYYTLLLQSDRADREKHLDELGNPDTLITPPADQNLFLKRTMYHTFDMLSEIKNHNLKYLPSNFTAYVHNPNIQPTVFIDKSSKKLYIYYSNMKTETQSYVLEKGNILMLYPGSTALAYGEALIYNIAPTQLYSNSGNSFLYKMNICYNTTDQQHPFEIQYINGPVINEPECSGLPGGAICLTVPANSYGYIEVPFYITPREGLTLSDDQIEVYPNPTANAFRITCDIPEELLNTFYVSVFDIHGSLLLNTVISQNQDIDISNLPSSIYFIVISNEEKSFSVSKKIIKI